MVAGVPTPGERVIAVAHPGIFQDLIPHIRYEVMRAGGVDLGVIDVLREPVPESFQAVVLEKGAREARPLYHAMLRDIDAAIRMVEGTARSMGIEVS